MHKTFGGYGQSKYGQQFTRPDNVLFREPAAA